MLRNRVGGIARGKWREWKRRRVEVEVWNRKSERKNGKGRMQERVEASRTDRKHMTATLATAYLIRGEQVA